MAVTGERTYPANRVVQNPETAPVTNQQAFWIDKMDVWLNYQSILFQRKPREFRAIQSAADALGFIQEDAWQEFGIANSIAKLLPEARKYQVISDNNIGRSVLFLVVANYANRLDEIVEQSIDHATQSGIPLSGEIVEQSMRLPAAIGNDGPISFIDMGTDINTQCDIVNVPKDVLTIDSILTAEVAHIDRLAHWVNDGDMYSVNEALESRLNTVGAYYHQLGGIATDNGIEEEKIMYELMGAQVEDDMFDVPEDIHTQMNPFVAALAQYGLLEQYVYEEESYKQGFMWQLMHESNQFLANHFGFSVDVLMAKAQAKWIRDFLVCHPNADAAYTDVFNAMLGSHIRQFSELLGNKRGKGTK